MSKLSIIFTLLFSFNAFSAEFKVCSGQAAFLNIFDKVNSALEEKFKVKAVPALDVTTAGSTESFDGLAQGKCEAIVIPTDFKQFVDIINKSGRKMEVSDYTSRVLGKDLIKVVCNSKLKPTTLTKVQLGAIFSGKVKNWKEINGEDLPISVFTVKGKQATYNSFKNQVLKGADYTADAKDVESWDDLVMEMDKKPGSISFMSENTKSKSLQVMKTDEEIGRPITMITKGKPSPMALKIAEFIQGEGQKIIRK